MYVCHSEGEWAGKDLSAFELGMVVDARRAPVCVKNCNAAGFFHVQQFPMCIKNDLPPKGHSFNLTQLWDLLCARIPVELLSVLGGSLMFCTLSVYAVFFYDEVMSQRQFNYRTIS